MSKHEGVFAVLTPLPEELDALRSRTRHARRLPVDGPGRYWRAELDGQTLVLGTTGDGRRRAREGLEALLRTRQVSALLVAGVAGALTPDLAPGDVVLAREIRDAEESWTPAPPVTATATASTTATAPWREGLLFTHERILARAHDKLALGEKLGAATAAVDLETAVYARVAAAHGIPHMALRAISDAAGEDLALDFARFADAHGHTRRGAVVLHALLRPWLFPALLRLRRRMRLCSERLATAIHFAIPSAIRL